MLSPTAEAVLAQETFGLTEGFEVMERFKDDHKVSHHVWCSLIYGRERSIEDCIARLREADALQQEDDERWDSLDLCRNQTVDDVWRWYNAGHRHERGVPLPLVAQWIAAVKAAGLQPNTVKKAVKRFDKMLINHLSEQEILDCFANPDTRDRAKQQVLWWRSQKLRSGRGLTVTDQDIAQAMRDALKLLGYPYQVQTPVSVTGEGMRPWLKETIGKQRDDWLYLSGKDFTDRIPPIWRAGLNTRPVLHMFGLKTEQHAFFFKLRWR